MKCFSYFRFSVFQRFSFYLKIPFFLPVFHGGFGAFVVGAGAAFGLAGGGDFGDDFIEVGCGGFDGAGAGGIADGAEANGAGGDGFVILCFKEVGDGEDLASAFEDFALVSEVDRGKGDFFAFDVHPDVHLGEVRERENAEVFAGVLASVEEVPEFGALVFRIPLAEVVAMREEAFFGTSLFFITASAAEAGVVLVLLDRVEERDGLKFVARGVGAFFLHGASGIDRFLHEADDEVGADEFDEFVAVGHGLIEVVSGIDVDEWEGHACGPEGFACKPCHDDRVLAAGKEQGGVLKLGGSFAKDEDRLGFELVEVAEVVAGHGDWGKS